MGRSSVRRLLSRGERGKVSYTQLRWCVTVRVAVLPPSLVTTINETDETSSRSVAVRAGEATMTPMPTECNPRSNRTC